MTITQQQQLALRRGVLYNASSNQFITFNPVTAGTNSLGPTPLEVIEISVPNLTGSSEVVTSAFTFPTSLFVNLTESGKTEQEVTVLNKVQGSTGSPYIFINEVLSAVRAPEVGDSVESFPGAFDGVYTENTSIEEVNPIISFKIVDIAIFGSSVTDISITLYLVPEQNFNLGSWNAPIGQRTVRHKFIVSTTPGLVTAANLLDSNPINKENLSKLLGYTEEDISNNLNADVTFLNFVKDIFGETLSERKFITTATASTESGTEQNPPIPWINGFAKVKCGWVGDPDEFEPDFTNFPDNRLHRLEIFIAKNQMRVYDFGNSPPSNPQSSSAGDNLFYLRSSGWNPNSANRPGSILFDTLITGASQKFNYVPSTGDFNTPVNNLQDDSSNDLFLYKLNQPLVNFVSSSISNSKTSIKGLVIAEVTTGLIRNFGSSINKNTLLDDWEAGYHQAGRILQNKLKK